MTRRTVPDPPTSEDVTAWAHATLLRTKPENVLRLFMFYSNADQRDADAMYDAALFRRHLKRQGVRAILWAMRRERKPGARPERILYGWLQ